jgi:hypothetical protein
MYEDHGETIRQVDGDGGSRFIPKDPRNRQYRKYLAWLDLGNTPDPKPPPPPPPPPSSARVNLDQAIADLDAATTLPDVKDAALRAIQALSSLPGI